MPPFITTYAAASKRGLEGYPASAIPEFTFSVNTTNFSTGAPANAVRIQFITPADGSMNINWGDGTSNFFGPGQTFTYTKTYSAPGTYIIKMTGKGAIKVVDAGRLASIIAWGSQFFWTDCSNAFKNAANLRAPNPITGYPRFANLLSCSGMFDGCYNWTSDMSGWDTSLVTDMSFMFRGCYEYFRSLNGVNFWNVSNVTNMESMFDGCGYFGYFNSNIDWTWNTSKVTNMRYMFANMFAGWSSRLIWDTSNVTDMTGMFYNGSWSPYNATGGICDWNTSKVTNMSYMFSENRFFNCNISAWDTSSVTNMSYMFNGDQSISEPHFFNQPIGTWNTSNVTNMRNMFSYCNFNQNINSWNVSKVTNMAAMFNRAFSFNQPLNNWDTANVTDMSYMFELAINFNQPLETLDTSKVTNMQSMFQGAERFNQPLGFWDVSKVTNMINMFSYSDRRNQNMIYNQNLSLWCVTLITSKPFGFDTNYTANNWTLPKPAWGTCPAQPFMAEVTFPAVGQINQYSASFDVQPNTSLYPVCTVDWGDGSPIESYSLGNTVSHTYPSVSATYTIKVQYTTAMKWRQLQSLTKITNWGTTPLGLLEFTGCTNLTTVTSPKPPLLVGSAILTKAFQLCTSLTGGVGFNNWSIPYDTSLLDMFYLATSFNWDLSNWCVPWHDVPPFGFSASTPAWTLPQPLWGSCSQSTALAWYDFTNNYSYPPPQIFSTVFDITRKSNNGTISNAPWSGTPGANAAGSLAFNGSTSQISIASIPSMSLTSANPVTMQLWFSLDNASSAQVLLNKWGGPGTEGYRLLTDVFGNRSLVAQTYIDGVQNNANSSTGILGNFSWYLVTWIVQLGVLNRLYLNTTQVMNQTSLLPTGTMNESHPFLIGKTQATDFSGINGRVGGFWFYPRALTLNEITSNFNNTKQRYGY